MFFYLFNYALLWPNCLSKFCHPPPDPFQLFQALVPRSALIIFLIFTLIYIRLSFFTEPSVSNSMIFFLDRS
jgi:hypothetical protein